MLQMLVKNGLCINSNAEFLADLAIEDGRIIQMGKGLDLPARQVVDASGKWVLPGIIDSHVHLPWPSSSFDSVDDIPSGTTAAACGGVTTIIEYIVPDESGRILPALQHKLDLARGHAFVDYSFHLILRQITAETLADMKSAVELGINSFKIYTAYAGFRLEDRDVLLALETARDLGAITCFHAEDGVLVDFATSRLAAAGKTSLRYYPEAHPRQADVEATARTIAYARHLNALVHIVHVNTSEGARMIGEARRSGLRITGETCPHYLLFTSEVYKTGKPEANDFVLSPVIREEGDRQALWDSLANGDLQTIATDHCPYTHTQKIKNGDDFRLVPGGGGGIETSLPLMVTAGVAGGRFGRQKMVELMSTNPAKIFNLFPVKGLLAIGSDADLVIYDPQPTGAIDIRNLHSKTDHTLYQGMATRGQVSATILRGDLIAKNGSRVEDKPHGCFLPRSAYPAGSPAL